jgi:flagella basal body P-ring formation protein FlgA
MIPTLLCTLAIAASHSTPQAAVAALPGVEVAPSLLRGVDRLPRPGPGVGYVAERTGRRGREVRIFAYRGRRPVAAVTVPLPRTAVHTFWVPTRELPPGEPIRAADLTRAELRLAGPVGPFAVDPSQLVGRVPRRTLVAGKPVRTASLVSPPVVHRGRPTHMFVRRGSLVVEAMGQALESGAEGDVVRVLNQRSSRVVFATVTGPNEVEVRR